MLLPRKAGSVIANLPKWFLYGLVLTALIAVLMLFSGKRPELPEDCEKANSALEVGDYDFAIDHYISCINTGDLPDRVLAAAYHNLASAYSAKGNHYRLSRITARPLPSIPAMRGPTTIVVGAMASCAVPKRRCQIVMGP